MTILMIKLVCELTLSPFRQILSSTAQYYRVPSRDVTCSVTGWFVATVPILVASLSGTIFTLFS
jgi:hypothetical protein